MAIQLVGFDADDTLWHSETHFSITEQRFQALVGPWSDPNQSAEALLAREKVNLDVFGYGVKGFTISMIETAIEVSDQAIPPAAIEQIIAWGKEMMAHPVELLDGVVETLDQVSKNHRIVLITKGDLFHQESKIAESGLADRFERVEILSEKSPRHYQEVLERCGGVAPENFLMVGNSLPSDILPVVEIGGHGAHVPYDLIWGHEKITEPIATDYHELSSLTGVVDLLDQLD